jgi:hypothetical protein
MAASSVTTKLFAQADFRSWAWWQTPRVPRAYVAVVVFAYAALTCYAVSQTTWRVTNLMTYLLLLGCALGSVAATTRSTYVKAG